MERLGVGIELTVWGMGLVFLLLGLLAGLIALLLRLERREPAASGTAADLGPELLAAVFLAVREHRRVRRKQAAPAMRSHQPGTLPSRWVGSGRTRQNRSWAPGGRYS